jgi:uncharacterized repeat protein (TIGR01451 family)
VTTQADVNAGGVTNLATATGRAPSTTVPVANGTDTVDVPATEHPGISVVKSASPTTFSAPGTTLTYTYVVTNTGNETLSTVSLSDSKLGTIAGCAAATLAPTASTTCTATHVTTQADLDAGGITNVATATGQPPTGPAETGTSAVDVTANQTPGIVVHKSASPTSFSAPGQTITYSYVVSNTGNVTLNPVSLSDSKVPAANISCGTPPVPGHQPGPLAPGQSETCSGTYTTTAADLAAGSVTNLATVNGTTPSGGHETDTDTVKVPATAISMVKSANPSMFTGAGQTITYTFKVSNIGATRLANIAIADPLPGLSPIVCQTTSLAVGAATTCTATYATTTADVNRGTLANSATATATDPSGISAAASSSTSVIPLVVQPPPTSPTPTPPTTSSTPGSTAPSAPPASVSPITPIPIQVTG